MNTQTDTAPRATAETETTGLIAILAAAGFPEGEAAFVEADHEGPFVQVGSCVAMWSEETREWGRYCEECDEQRSGGMPLSVAAWLTEHSHGA